MQFRDRNIEPAAGIVARSAAAPKASRIRIKGRIPPEVLRSVAGGCLFAAVLSTGAQAPLTSMQRTGGPLPLSIRNEVEAAEARALPRLEAICLGETSLPATAETRFWALLALRTAQAGIQGADVPLPPAFSGACRETAAALTNDVYAAAKGRLLMHAAFVAGTVAGGKNEAAGASGVAFCEQLLERLVSRTAAEQASVQRQATNEYALIASLDALRFGGAAGNVSPRLRQLARKARAGIRERREQGLASSPHDSREDAVSLVRGALLSIELARLCGDTSEDEAHPQLLGSLAEQWQREVSSSTGPATETSWFLARCLNALAPGSLYLSDGKTPLDWRLLGAEALLSSQRVDPATGTGYWQVKADATKGNGAAHTVEATPFAVLVLEQLR